MTDTKNDFSQRLNHFIQTVESPTTGAKARFASKLSVGNGVVSKWCYGQYPSADKIKAMKEIYNLDINWLFTGEGEMFLNDLQKSLHKYPSIS